jgi:hypothetical protein
MKLQPAPLTTNITNDNRLTTPWEIWFRNISQNLTDSTKYNSNDNIDWTLNGNILFVNYSGIGGLTFNLPKPSAINQILSYHYLLDTGAYYCTFLDILKDDSKIIIPEKNMIKLTGTILLQQNNR